MQNKMYTNNGIAQTGGELAYDLRQMYAKIVGEHLEDIALARKADNYSVYFKTLKDLFIIVKHKFKEKKIKIIDDGKEKEIPQLEYYNTLISSAVKLANEHPRTWLGQDKDPGSCAEIEISLNEIEMFLYEKIDAAKMFGGSNSTPGL